MHRRRHRDARTAVPPSEWAVAALGALLVLATLGYLGYGAVQGAGSPPRLSVRVDSVVAGAARQRMVMFTVRNDGERTAANVVVQGEVGSGEVGERSTATLDYVPARSERGGALLFLDTTRAIPALRVVGYEEP